MLILLLPAASPAFAQAPPAAAGTVTLPLAAYDRLLERAATQPAPPVAPLVNAVVARADLVLRAGPDVLRGTVTMQGEVFQGGTVAVPLLAGGTIVDAVQGVSPAPLVLRSGTVAAVLRGPAAFSIEATWAAPLATEPGRAGAELPAVHAGSVHATIELPGDHADVRVDPGIVTSRSAAGGRTTVDVTLEPGVASRVSWSSRESGAAATRAVRLVSDVKSMLTIGENDVRIGALFDVAVTVGDARTIAVLLPAGFDVASLTGATVESEEVRDGRLILAVREGARRRHQFLLALERSGAVGPHTELLPPAVEGAQRETGEIAMEAIGTAELTAAESKGLRRLDVSEVADATQALARSPLLAAFRYQRRGAERPAVVFDVKRFADAPVLAAAAERADATTLVTAEGRTLTEVSLVLRNRGQQFLKLGLPQGASLVSAAVGGEPVKPVEGADGARVPLVRPGFQPPGAYVVSFVYLASGSPLGKRGEAALSLPRMDLPLNLVQWELFVPDGYDVRRFEGDLLRQDLVGGVSFVGEGETGAVPAFAPAAALRMDSLGADDVGGFCLDPQGAALPGVKVTVSGNGWSRSVVTDLRGAFVVSAVPTGSLILRAELAGFTTAQYHVRGGGPPILATLGIAGVSETVRVTADAPRAEQKAADIVQSQAASQNVLNLQRRVSGVLPVRIDVPRAGHSYVLLRPLVLDEPTTVRFEYRSR